MLNRTKSLQLFSLIPSKDLVIGPEESFYAVFSFIIAIAIVWYTLLAHFGVLYFDMFDDRLTEVLAMRFS